MCYHSEVMHCYEQINPFVERMLVLARSGDWAALPAMETQYSNMVDHLKAIEPLNTLDEAQLARKYQLLSRITANHAEISSILMPQLEKLGATLRSLEQQHNLKNMYGQSSLSL